MIIDTIEIQNFLSYHGGLKENKLYFGKGPTIIIGQNDTGKSKLFDAFSWAMFDRAYMSEEQRWSNPKELKEYLVNKLAKHQAEIGEEVTALVRICFHDANDNDYMLERELSIKKTGNNQYQELSDSSFKLTKTDSISQNTEDFSDRFNELYPQELSHYFLLQGENISDLINLRNRTAFERAIKDISQFKIFKDFTRHAEKVKKRIQRELESKDDSSKVESLRIDLEKKEDEHKKTEERLTDDFEERTIAKRKLQESEDKLRTYDECRKLLKQIKTLEEDIRTKRKERKDFFERQRTEILDLWSYVGLTPHFENYQRLYQRYKKENKIPEKISQSFIQEMIEKQVCGVCGRDATRDSEPYKKILSHKNPDSLGSHIELIHHLEGIVESIIPKTKSVPEYIETFYNDVEKIDSEIRKLRKEHDKKELDLESEVHKLEDDQRKNISASDIEKIDFNQIKKDRDKFKIDVKSLNISINKQEAERDLLKKQINKLKDEIEDEIEKSSAEIEKEKYRLAGNISENAQKLHDNFFQKLIQDIEEKANEYFNKMTQHNRSLYGRLRIDHEANEVYPIDQTGQRIQNINSANIVSIQIAFVAAVIAVSGKFWNRDFPFIADAPISALGGNNKLSAVQTMCEIFSQSIIILKDDAMLSNKRSKENDLIRQFIKSNKNIIHAYELRMNKDEMDPIKKTTQIVELK